MNLHTALGRFRAIALLEGVSFLALFVTMILKYQFAMPRPNYVVGLAHGVLFIAYLLALVMAGTERNWGYVKMFLLFLTSLVPFGAFWADAKWLRDEDKQRV